jgi:hypothetical protein
MVESIQSAPHMAFTIYLVELDPFIEEDHALLIIPKVVSKTLEVERSVIKIQVDHEKRKHTIDSEVPEEKGKGTKPIITPEQFLNSLSKPEFRKPIEKFWDDWRKIGGDIRFGTSGLSAGITQGEKRTPILFIYHNCISTISETHRNSYDIPDDFYQEYKNDLRESQVIYDGYVVGNRVNVPFNAITEDDLLLLFKASMNIAKKLVGEI